MITLGQVESTYVCQFNKPENRKRLEEFVKNHDSSGQALAEFYQFVIVTLRPTLAWNVSGVNKLINKLSYHVRATLNHERRGKTTAWAQANQILYTVNSNKDREAPTWEPSTQYRKTDWLKPLVTPEELLALSELT